jgi:phosphoenolpyruvate-protein phosphotransferase
LSRRLAGVAAAPGVAVAPPWRYEPAAAGGAALSLDAAARAAAAELERPAAMLREAGRAEEAQIFDAQVLMAGDPGLLGDAQRLVDAGATPAEAVRRSGDDAAGQLETLDDELLAARGADVRDVAERIARLASGDSRPQLDKRSVVVAVDLPPSVTAELDRSLLAGIAMEAGSRTAHAAILARSLGIPAVVGVSGLLSAVGDSRQVAVDGDAGEVLLDPSSGEVEARLARAAAGPAELSAEPLATRDGTRFLLAANIGRPEEARPALERGAEAIGLFRTEFLFMGRREAPSEEEQTRAYAQVLEAFGERPVVIRLIDLGGDKQLPYLPLPAEDNPFLGVRGFRLVEHHADLLLTQLRAILAAGERTATEPWIMAPMIADLDDVQRLHALVAEAAAGRSPRRPPRIGVMIELPAAVLQADKIAAEVAFMSIGTNDLTQYLFAADRTNPALAGRQDALHPAVLRSIAATVDAGHGAGIPVAVCGEMAGDPIGAVALVGLGIDELSMDAGAFRAVKRTLAAVSREDAAAAVAEAMDATRASGARAILERLLAR